MDYTDRYFKCEQVGVAGLWIRCGGKWQKVRPYTRINGQRQPTVAVLNVDEERTPLHNLGIHGSLITF